MRHGTCCRSPIPALMSFIPCSGRPCWPPPAFPDDSNSFPNSLMTACISPTAGNWCPEWSGVWIIVAVSAVGGGTDLILKTIDAARHGDPAATEAGLKKFETVHEALIADLFAQPRAGTVLEFAHKVFAQLRNSCHALLALRSDVS